MHASAVAPNLPAGQTLTAADPQLTAPVSAAFEGHGSQATEPIAAWNIIAEHGVQAALPAELEYMPAPQLAQFDEDAAVVVAEAVPGWQDTQVDDAAWT